MFAKILWVFAHSLCNVPRLIGEVVGACLSCVPNYMPRYLIN